MRVLAEFLLPVLPGSLRPYGSMKPLPKIIVIVRPILVLAPISLVPRSFRDAITVLFTEHGRIPSTGFLFGPSFLLFRFFGSLGIVGKEDDGRDRFDE